MVKRIKNPIILGVAVIGFAIAGFGTSYALTKHQIVKSSPSLGPINVSLANDSASPNSLAIKVGQIVQFNTKDNQNHDIAFGEGNADGHDHEHTSSYESGQFGSGQAWQVQFKKAGTFTLHDHLHPNINVIVVAYNPSK